MFLRLYSNLFYPGTEEPGAHRNCGGIWLEPGIAGSPYYSPAPVEVGCFLFILLLPLVFKLWDLFM